MNSINAIASNIFFLSANQNRNRIGKNIRKRVNNIVVGLFTFDCIFFLWHFLTIETEMESQNKINIDARPEFLLNLSMRCEHTKKTWIAIRFLFLKVFFVLQHFLISNESNVKMWNNSSTFTMQFAAILWLQRIKKNSTIV